MHASLLRNNEERALKMVLTTFFAFIVGAISVAAAGSRAYVIRRET